MSLYVSAQERLDGLAAMRLLQPAQCNIIENKERIMMRCATDAFIKP